MIYGGDEIGNSQEGNNNAYCQDNSIGWIDWRDCEKMPACFAFVKRQLHFGRLILSVHMSESMKEADYLGKGFPDMSFSWGTCMVLQHGKYQPHDRLCRGICKAAGRK